MSVREQVTYVDSRTSIRFKHIQHTLNEHFRPRTRPKFRRAEIMRDVLSLFPRHATHNRDRTQYACHACEHGKNRKRGESQQSFSFSYSSLASYSRSVWPPCVSPRFCYAQSGRRERTERGKELRPQKWEGKKAQWEFLLQHSSRGRKETGKKMEPRACSHLKGADLMYADRQFLFVCAHVVEFRAPY